MTSTIMTELERLVAEHATDWPPADRELAFDIGRDYALLLVQAAAGEDVTEAVAEAAAQVQALQAAASYSGRSLFLEAISTVTSRVVATLVAGLMTA